MPALPAKFSLPVAVGAAALTIWGLVALLGSRDGENGPEAGESVMPGEAAAPQPRSDLVPQGSATVKGNQPPDADGRAPGTAPHTP